MEEKGKIEERCPRCGQAMWYYEPMKDWYCNTCKLYKYQILTQTPGVIYYNAPPVDSFSRRSNLGILGFIVGLLCLMAIFLLFFGVGGMDNWLSLHSNSDSGYYYDYYNDEPNPMTSGAMNVAMSSLLFAFAFLVILLTIARKEWWNRLQGRMDLNSTDPWANIMLKRGVVGIFNVFFGVLVIAGVLLMALGIYFVNRTTDSDAYLIFATQFIVGIVLVIASYFMHQRFMERLSSDIYPLIFEKR